MLFSNDRMEILKDDLVVAYMSPEHLEAVKVTSGSILHNKYGRFSHDEIIGKTFGCKWKNLQQNGHLYVLKMTPDLWTRVLPHRTQIIYLPDISFIIQKLEIMAGKVVIESGTGSGSMSHHIACSIFPNGHLYTFDFHDKRVEQATREFAEHGLNDIVTCTFRNVIEEGFGKDIQADCVFLDLPAPWDAIAHSKNVLKKNMVTRICSYSPCIEQVQKTIKALLENDFCEIEMYECLTREYEVSVMGRSLLSKRKLNEQEMLISKPMTEMKGHTSFLTFAKLIPML